MVLALCFTLCTTLRPRMRTGLAHSVAQSRTSRTAAVPQFVREVRDWAAHAARELASQPLPTFPGWTPYKAGRASPSFPPGGLDDLPLVNSPRPARLSALAPPLRGFATSGRRVACDVPIGAGLGHPLPPDLDWLSPAGSLRPSALPHAGLFAPSERGGERRSAFSPAGLRPPLRDRQPWGWLPLGDGCRRAEVPGAQRPPHARRQPAGGSLAAPPACLRPAGAGAAAGAAGASPCPTKPKPALLPAVAACAGFCSRGSQNVKPV